MRALVSLASEWGRPMLRVPTGSMRPTLREGDMLAVERCGAGDLRRGDVVIFERAGRMWAHRLLGGGGERMLVKGDARLRPDAPVRPEEVLGRARYAVRDGRRVELSGRWARIKGAAVGLAYPVASLPFRAGRALCRRLLGGRRSIRVEMGGVRLDVKCPDASLAADVLAVAGHHGPTRRGVDAEIILRRSTPCFEEPIAAGARREGGRLVVWGPGFRLRLDPARRAAVAELGPGAGRAEVSCILRNVTTEFAARAGRSILHASCSIRRGMVFVFAGPSGSGKTTCAAMLPGARKVLDDLVFVAVDGGGARVLSSPDFDREGTGLSGEAAEVAAVFVLSPEGEDRPDAEELTGARAAAALCSLPCPAPGEDGTRMALDAAEALASRVRVVRLRFGHSAECLDEIARCIEEGRELP